jgi:hypothetical protein
LVEQLLDLAWSHWAALGVAGSVRPAEVPVDLEALLLLTAELAAEDPRLRDEALDWCSRFHGFASKPRLKQLLRRLAPGAQSAFGPFAGALEQHAGTPWPSSSGAASAPTSLSGKSRLPALTRPALLSLRLRALFGVGARADIIGAVLSRRSEDFGAADLVFIGYSKRNLAEALDMLAAAGLFRTTRTGNRVRFSWQRREQLSALLAPLPDVIPVWSSTLRVMSGFLDLLTRTQTKSDRLVAVEAARCLRQLSNDLQALGVEPPDLPAMTRDALSDWVLSTSALLVRSGSPSPDAANKAPRTRTPRGQLERSLEGGTALEKIYR